MAAFVYIPPASCQIAVNHKSTGATAAEAQVEQKLTLENVREETLASHQPRKRPKDGVDYSRVAAGLQQPRKRRGRRSPLLSARLSPLSQLFPPNPSGQSQLKEPHRLTQVPPFRHGLVLQKCLLAEQPGTQVIKESRKQPPPVSDPTVRTREGLKEESRSAPTWQGAVVGDEAGHVHVLVVHTQVPYAAHKLPVADGEVLGELGNASQKQGPGQVQGPEETQCYTSPGCITKTHQKFITEAVSRLFPPERHRTRRKTLLKAERSKFKQV